MKYYGCIISLRRCTVRDTYPESVHRMFIRWEVLSLLLFFLVIRTLWMIMTNSLWHISWVLLLEIWDSLSLMKVNIYSLDFKSLKLIERVLVCQSFITSTLSLGLGGVRIKGQNRGRFVNSTYLEHHLLILYPISIFTRFCVVVFCDTFESPFALTLVDPSQFIPRDFFLRPLDPKFPIQSIYR